MYLMSIHEWLHFVTYSWNILKFGSVQSEKYRVWAVLTPKWLDFGWYLMPLEEVLLKLALDFSYLKDDSYLNKKLKNMPRFFRFS
jgi:hypothetical protein